MSRLGTITRRSLLVGAAALAGGVAVGYWYVRRPYPNPLEGELADGETTFNPYVKIAPDNRITVVAPRAEMGQGVSTTLAAMVAEEMQIGLDQLTVEHGPASFAYFNTAMMEDAGPFPWFDESVMAEMARTVFGSAGKLLGLQATGGSSSTRDGFERMRQAGAAARTMLVSAAAARLGVAEAELQTDRATIMHKASGRSLTYGEVAADAAKLEAPSTVRLKEKADWTILGKPQKRVDMLAKVTGAPIFGIDVFLPDMLFGTVRMSPRFHARPVSSDFAKALAVPGVQKVVPVDSTYGHGFGVIADSTWAAFRGAAAIEVEWGAADYPVDDAAIDAALMKALADGGGSLLRDDGDADAAFKDAGSDRVISADYAAPMLAHACMEPMNATARFRDGKLEIWSPNQVPMMTAQLCASAVGIERDDATVHTTSLGGGFGRREMDFSIYAAIIARQAGGRPVKVTWSREEDIQHDVYRPPARARMKARLGADGLPVALDIEIAAPSVLASMLKRTFPSLSPVGPDPTITQGSHDQPLTISSYRVAGIKADLNIPVGFWRSVGNSFNGFFHESFLDEAAYAGGIDPVEQRKRLMAVFPSALAVVDKVAAMSAWGEKLPEGRARGFAFTLSFGSWVGEVVEIAQTPTGIRIEKVWIAADVGTALDPGIIEAQLVSGAIFGLSAAIGQSISLKDGMVEQSNFHDFDAMRIFQCPSFEVAILQNHPKMGGVGEIGTPPAAPALANAVFALTGKRIRTLPLNREVVFA